MERDAAAEAFSRFLDGSTYTRAQIDFVWTIVTHLTENGMTVTVSTPWQLMGCPACGVVAVGRGRRLRRLHDVPGAVPVVVRWRQRTWRCPGAGCPVGVFVEQHPSLVRPRGSLTCRAVTWAIGQLRHEHATIEGLSRQLGTTWKALWRAVRPRSVELADDERGDPVQAGGVGSGGAPFRMVMSPIVRCRAPA